MKRATAFLLLVTAILVVTTSVILAKGGQQMEHVCWMSPRGEERHAHFMVTSSGIIHRFGFDGRHDIYKLAEDWKKPGKGEWELWTAKSHGECAEAGEAPAEKYLKPDKVYWHRHN